MLNIYIVTIALICMLIICGLINTYEKNKNIKTCNLDNFDINNIRIIKRDTILQDQINKLVDDKAYLFTDDEINTLKNKFQVYYVKDDNIQNISDIFLSNCKNNLDNMDKDDMIDNIYLSEEELKNIKYNIENNDSYNKIINEFNKQIKNLDKPNCNNTKFLKKGKLENYYYDIFGNNIISTPKDYMANYYTTINDVNSKLCIPVKTEKGKNSFIIPDPYANFKPFQGSIQNAYYYYENHNNIMYNIDNDRLINPLTTY